MADVTVLGTAAQQLRPLENTNIGTIVEENIRYWKKFDDEQEAARKAAAARQAEFEYKKNKDKQDAGIKVAELFKSEDSDGFWNFQVAQYNSKQAEKLYEDQLKYKNGEIDLDTFRLRTSKKTENMRVVANLNNLTKEKEGELGEPHPVLDRKAVGLIKAFQSLAVIDPETSTFKFLDPVNNVEKTYTIPELISEINNIKFTPQTDFDKKTKEIVDLIGRDVVNGNKFTTKENRETALNYALDLMNDTNKAIEYAYKTNFLNSAENPAVLDVIESYTPEQMAQFKAQMAQEYANEKIVPALDQVNNSLSNEEKRLNLQEKRQKIALERSIAQVATDGTIVRDLTVAGNKVTVNQNEVPYIRPEAAKDIFVNINGKNAKYVGHSTATDGTTTLFALEEYVEKQPVRDLNGNIVYGAPKPILENGSYKVKKDSKGNAIIGVDGKPEYVFKQGDPVTEEIKKSRLVKTKNETIITSVFGSIPGADGRYLNNATETARSYQQDAISKIGTTPSAPAQPNQNTTPTPKFN